MKPYLQKGEKRGKENYFVGNYMTYQPKRGNHKLKGTTLLHSDNFRELMGGNSRNRAHPSSSLYGNTPTTHHTVLTLFRTTI